MNSYLSLFGMLYSATQEKQLKKLEQRVAQAEQKLPLNKTLEAFHEDDKDDKEHK